MTTPSVIGRPLAEAQRLVCQAGLQVTITHTSPPASPPSGPRRIIRQRLLPEGVELVVAASVPLSEGKDVRD